ncbi:uncharacterized protein LOC112083367 [Eutrema salsugineum]|uniref:uncharacterized protein LOC112083367 n=1 Tax=Eutrema salsugineum TaxID=72664 RepID=UPI000CED0A66|nr:uncharacterized protein LOC112083367 [Eutrema salsugineum]
MSSSCMVEIFLVCGKWEFAKTRYLFLVDKSKGCRVVAVDREIEYGDFRQVVYEDLGLDQRRYDIQFSYMLSKRSNDKLPKDTPPVFVGNPRQFAVFLRHFENETIRLCAEITSKASREYKEKEDADELNENRSNEFTEEDNEDDQVDKDDEDDQEERFDNCDDPDGASSSDEDYGLCGKYSEDEEDMQNLPPKKCGSARMDDFVEMEMKSMELAVGQCYETKEEFETRLKIYAVANKMDYDVGYSTPTLLTVKCWVGGCKWRVRASSVGDKPEFYVKTYYGVHTCSITMRSSRARQATPEILARLYKDFVGGVGNTITPNHVSDALTKRYGIKVEYWKAYRVLKYARELVTGISDDSYEELPSYLYMIRRANPGTLIKLDVDMEDKFKFMFIAFGASIQGFPFMRKVVVVDGTFLTGKSKGTLLIATTQDGNFNIFPIAFAIVDTENDESWEWLFTQLHRVIPDDEGLAMISDRHRSIRNAIKKVYPLSARGGEAFRLVKKAASTYKLSDFNVFMAQIQQCNRGSYNYLQKADVCMWSRVHFPGQRYNFTTSNIAESLNKVLSKVRSYPIVTLLEEIRSLLTRWFAKRRRAANDMETELTTGVEKLLRERVEGAKQLAVQDIDDHLTQVTSGASLHVVNLGRRSCTCRRFDIDKIPCVHAVATAEARKISRISLAHPYYRTSYLRSAYAGTVMPRDIALPVPDEVASKVCKPPFVRKPPGRPKKSRMKSALEIAMQKKRPRKEHKCSKCGQGGHNRATCPS